MRLFASALIVLLYANPVAARDVTEAGSVAATGATVNASTGTAEDVSLAVTSTGADRTGPSVVSSASATGVQGSNGTAFTVRGVTVTATSGPVTQQGPNVNAGSFSTARGVQLSGNSPQTLTASDLSVRAVSDTATGTSTGRRSQGRADAFAAGIWLFSTGDAALSGTSSVEALAGTSTVSGGDSLSVATAQATGASVGQPGASGVSNLSHSGRLTVQAVGGKASATGLPAHAEAWAEAVGLQTSSGQVTNTGTLQVSAIGGTASALSASPDRDNLALAHAWAKGIVATDTVTNSGDLQVTATGGTSQNAFITNADSVATGIVTTGDVLNTGRITVRATTTPGTATGIQTTAAVVHTGDITVDGDTATGIRAGSVKTTGNVNVSGDTVTGIRAGSVHMTGSVNVSGDTATALQLTDGADVYTDGTITAQGRTAATGLFFDGAGSLYAVTPIGVSGGNPWEVVSGQAGQTVRVSAYNLGLGRDTGRTFGGPGNLYLDKATLTLRPAPGFVENRYFAVQTPQNGQSELGDAVVSGQVSRVVSTHPDLQAALRSETTGQSVALLYEPPASLPGESIHAQQTTVMYAGTVLRDHLAESLFMPTLSSESHGQLFARPYAMRLTHTGGPAGYHGTLSGALFGVTGRVGDTLLGVHLGGDVTNLDFRGVYDGRSEESTALYGGVHAGQRWDNGLGVMLTSTLFRADHRADYDTEHATAQSLAWFNTLGLNWRWQLTPHQALVPEASLMHIWQFRNNYHTKAAPNSVSSRYEEFNNHEVFGTAGLRWVLSLPVSSGILRLHTGGGVQQTLTDGKIRVEQFMDGTRHARPDTQSDRTLGFASAGIGFDFERLSLDLGWQGSFSSHTQAQGLQAIVRYQF